MLIIGEKINGTRKQIAEAINNRDRELIVSVVRAQDLSGADVIDVNAATGKSDVAQEIGDMDWLACWKRRRKKSATHSAPSTRS